MSFVRLLGLALALTVVTGFSLWGILAIWHGTSLPEGMRLALGLGLGLLGIAGLVRFFVRRKPISLLPWVLGMAAIFTWWSTIEPSNDRNWEASVARLPFMTIEGERVTIGNVRNFVYRSESDFEQRWEERSYDLGLLDSLDLIAVYWMGDAIAHTILSFGFAGEQVAISIEIRKERGEDYSAVAGLFRRYELAYVVGADRNKNTTQ